MEERAFPYLDLVIAFVAASYAFETFLDVRQFSALLLPSLPPSLQSVVSEEKFVAARAYSLDKARVGLVKGAADFVLELAMLWGKILPWIWQLTSLDYQWVWGISGRNEIEHSILFIFASSLVSQVLDLPFSLYATFVVEERHGFNKQTLFGFLKDRLLGLLLMAILLPPVLAACIRIVQLGGSLVAVYLWLFIAAFSLFMLTLYPLAIAPLFNKFVPLASGPLRTRIEALAGSLNYPLKKIFVMDGSQRSSHSNAYLYGFFKNKRIVLYDTLLSHCAGDDAEVVAVIAHELGHWKLGHTLRFFALSQLLLLLQCAGFVFVRSQPSIFRSFGFNEEPVIIAILLFQHLSTPLSHFLDFGLNVISRAFEYQADAFAVGLGYAAKLRSALIKMQEENLSTMNTDAWYSAYHHSHPCLPERLARIDARAKNVLKKEH